MENRNYREAEQAFEQLGDYRDADTMRKEAKYRYAAQLADKNEFDASIEQYEILKDWGYKDAEVLSLETRYREATYLLYEERNYQEAYNKFAELTEEGYSEADAMCKEALYWEACDLLDQENYLKAYEKLQSIRGYSDVDDIIEALTEIIYAEGQNFYHDGAYDEAEEYFKCISPFSESEAYLTLIGAHRKDEIDYWLSYRAGTLQANVQELIDLFYFEDAAELLVSETYVACEFLFGRWQTSNGWYYFEITEAYDDDHNYHSSYNLPWYGGSFSIDDGVYSVSNDSYNDKPQFRFTLITPNCMDVYCYKDGTTYTLYRQ